MIWFHEKPSSPKDRKSHEPLEWTLFSQADCLLLEQEFQASQSEGYKGDYTVTVGSDLLFQVNILHKTLLPIYWTDAELAVRRGCWFEKPNSKDSWHPSVYADQLEGVFDTLRARSMHFASELPHGSAVNSISLSRKGTNLTEPFTLTEGVAVTFPLTDLTTGTISSSCPSAKTTKVSRRSIDEFAKEMLKPTSFLYSNATAAAAQQENATCPPKHLILIIHGIGQKFFDKIKKYNFIEDVDIIRGTMKEVACKKGLPIDFQVLPIQWRVNLNLLGNNSKGSQEFDEMLTKISLPTITSIRTLMSDLALDVLLYMHPTHYERIIDYLIGELNRVHSLFVRHNPAFTGKISIIGHSLGSVLAFDLLSCPFDEPDKAAPSCRLDFKIDKFWALGSPVGMFLLLKGINLSGTRKALSGHVQSEILKKNVFLDCNELYNIFHPNDPCAFRIEPLLWPEMHTVAPFALKGLGKIMNYVSSTIADEKDKSWRLTRSFRTLLSATSITSSSNSSLEDGAKKITRENLLFAPFNPIKRLDFIIAEKMFEYSYISMLSAHTIYWRDRETSEFIVGTLQ